MRAPVVDRPARGDDRLCSNEPAKNSRSSVVGCVATKQIHVQALEIEPLQKGCNRCHCLLVARGFRFDYVGRAVEHVVVVGASLAGIRAVEFLRRKKFAGAITLVGAEMHLPYDRPPLSKEILRGEWAPERLALRRKPYEELELALQLGVRATALDCDFRRVSLSDGSTIAYDGLVIATGACVRKLPNQPSLRGVYTLRTLDDALAIRAALERAPRVVVIGAGFIGAEVAASARQLGLDATMVEMLEQPLARSLGGELGAEIVALHQAHGVVVRCRRRVTRFLGNDALQGVELDDGSRVDCELAVVGIGVVPATQWLEGSAVDVDNGVLCDATCAATAPDVVAVGDVASWYNPLFEERMRVEHWTNAVEQARHAIDTLLGGPTEAKPFESVPMFWSDQYDVKIQGVGRPLAEDAMLTRRKPGGDRNQLAALYSRDGRLTGAVTFNQPATIIELRKLISERANLDDALKIVDA